MAAAYELRGSGLKVTLLEANHRLGGRTWGKYWAPANRMLDMGGTWLLPSFAQTWALLAELGIDTVKSPASDIYLTHLSQGVEQRQYPSAREYADLSTYTERLREVIEASVTPMSAAQALAAMPEAPLGGAIFARDWHVATQRYLASADLSKVDATHLLLDLEDVANPEHYQDQIAGTSDALLQAMVTQLDCEILLGQEVLSIVRGADGLFGVATQDGQMHWGHSVVAAVPLNVLGEIRFDPVLSGGLADLAAARHVGAARKDWMVLDGVGQHFRVYGSAGPYGYLRSEGILADGAVLAVGLVPADESNPTVQELELAIREYFPEAIIRELYSHDWNADAFARGTWLVPRPGQFAALANLGAQVAGLEVVGGDLDEAAPGTIEGAIASGRRAARKLQLQHIAKISPATQGS